MLWIDQDDAQPKIDAVHDPKVRAVIQSLRDDGFAVLKGALTDRECDELINDFDTFCRTHPEESEKARLAEGFRSRLYNIHTFSAAGMTVALNSWIMDVLDLIFSRRGALNTTLFFEQGSQQHAHRDTPFFTSLPMAGEYVGVWYALEDVHEDAGPLSYYPGAHKIAVDIGKARQAGGGDATRVGEMFKHYNQQIVDGITAGGFEEKKLLLRKGDAAIWHPELPHGGSPINVKQRSRRSLVAHYIPEGAYVQPVGYFFNLEPPRQIMEFTDTGRGRLMRWVEPPVFMPNT